jgi:hypothetical protein
MAKDHPTFSSPRYFVFLRPAMVFIEPKAFLDPLADALADGIAPVAGRPPIDGGALAQVLGDMRRHVDFAQFHEEVGGIEALSPPCCNDSSRLTWGWVKWPPGTWQQSRLRADGRGSSRTTK